MSLLIVSYYIILIITAIKSILLCRKYNLSAQNFLFIYLLYTIITELISRVRIYYFQTLQSGFIYNAYFIFCIAFFFLYYFKIIQRPYKAAILLITTLFLLSVIFFSRLFQLDFDYRLGIILPLFYISIGLVWFYQKILLPTAYKITDDPNFWVSVALILWSCFFLFRSVPMYYFNINDKAFLHQLKNILYIVNAIMYTLFYIALTKYEKMLLNK